MDRGYVRGGVSGEESRRPDRVDSSESVRSRGVFVPGTPLRSILKGNNPTQNLESPTVSQESIRVGNTGQECGKCYRNIYVNFMIRCHRSHFPSFYDIHV